MASSATALECAVLGKSEDKVSHMHSHVVWFKYKKFSAICSDVNCNLFRRVGTLRGDEMSMLTHTLEQV